jgi:hypothetical protein
MVDMSHTAILIAFTSYTRVPTLAKSPSEAARSENLGFVRLLWPWLRKSGNNNNVNCQYRKYSYSGCTQRL